MSRRYMKGDCSGEYGQEAYAQYPPKMEYRERKEECECKKPCHPEPKREECECKKPHHKCTLPYEAVREMRAAIDDELGAMAEYATLARKLKDNPLLQAWFTNIAGDEYGHARAIYMTLAAAGCVPCKHWEEE